MGPGRPVRHRSGRAGPAVTRSTPRAAERFRPVRVVRVRLDGQVVHDPEVARRLCLAGLLDGAVSTKREARRAIAVLFRWPIGLTTTLRRGRQPCRGCGLVGGARLGAGAVRLGYSP